jgi:hypothetical protein
MVDIFKLQMQGSWEERSRKCTNCDSVAVLPLLTPRKVAPRSKRCIGLICSVRFVSHISALRVGLAKCRLRPVFPEQQTW